MTQITTKSRIWKYLLAGMVVVLVTVAALVPRPAPVTSYRRYVSPPLPDGVRCTFLYPSTLDHILSYSFSGHYKGKLVQLASVSKEESRWPGASLWHNWFKPEGEFVNVVVEKPTTKPLKSSRLEERREKHGAGAYEVEIEHTITVDDPRAHEHFRFWHASDFGTDSFKQHDSTVTSSFRILMPGDPVPSP